MNADEDQKEDIEWLESLPETYDWVTLKRLKGKRLKPKQMNTGRFYPNTIDEKTIYIRFDDDIVYVDDDFFHNILDFRIDNPEYFLVFANIWNNAILSYIHQRLGNIPPEPVVEDAFCMNPVAWRSGKFAEDIHNLLIDKILSGTVSDLFFGKAELHDAKRFSISCFAFFGKDFKKFEGIVGYKDGKLVYDEEIWLTEIYTITNNLLSVICGSALVAHYSFFAQRPYLDKTDILKQYKEIGKEKLSDAYYELLDGQREHEKPTGLKDFTLPPSREEDSDIIVALRAEASGYRAVYGDSGVVIYQNDEVIARISGQNVPGSKVDRMIANQYKKRGGNASRVSI